MSIPQLKYCPGTLAEGFETYSPGCHKGLFSGKKVSHILPFESPKKSEKDIEMFMENSKLFSISGVQEKFSLIQVKNTLRLTTVGEQGTHILKPIPALLKKVNMVPANEHLTMQIARQVYAINTATNAMIFFKDGSPAYITKRFDVKQGGGKWRKEDFASLAGKTPENSGPNFKYGYSYEELGLLIQKFVPAWKVEIEKYFIQVLFNFLFSNGDAHLKNFSLLENPQGDFILSPAYDLVNSRMHVDGSDFALTKGLFADDFKSPTYMKKNHPCKDDFTELGKRVGVVEHRIEKIMMPFLEKQAMVETLTHRSFLDEAGKRGYLLNYNARRNFLNG